MFFLVHVVITQFMFLAEYSFTRHPYGFPWTGGVRACAIWRDQNDFFSKRKRIEMLYSTNQWYHWKLNQSEVAISGRLANQKPGKKNWLVVQNVGWGCSLRRPCPITFYELPLLMVICPLPGKYRIYLTRLRNGVKDELLYIYICCVVLQGCPSPVTFYELAVLLVICPFPAILFLLSASYNLIIFYELVLSLVICPFPAILFS